LGKQFASAVRVTFEFLRIGGSEREEKRHRVVRKREREKEKRK
jgi:hypothetical protein